MKIKEGFIVRQMAGTNVAVPSGDVMDLDMMITLNDTGCFLWEQLQEEKSVDELVSAVLANYEVDEATARDYIVKFTDRLKELDFLA